ncbi:serine/threonine-protein kinase [Schlesneria paludicola]|uniref:serine/threonine-protein kinase n=1 Tax=Schlesneria paludicola TaxID=360056 RepID=UPI00029AA59F|nr:serine/threonine-protein kinase [Schlesneria paludicola]
MSELSLCRSERILDFLTERLDDSQIVEFERHLDQCEDCCRELQRRTADQSLWDDARALLSSIENAAGATIRTADNNVTSSVERMNLDFLGPTDDPRMLGRIGCYEVSGVIGCGGMGLVLKAFDPALNRYAAIKVLAPHFASSGAAKQRFAREAQAAAAVVHDNVVAIHGVDEYRGIPYLVMPYIKGESLQKRIDRDGPLSLEEILRIAMQTARGLAAAHDQGLVHRDIKPGNILLLANVERVMITDFGLARAADDASLTRSGVIAGTPQYMSPEQARGEGIDARSDLFSLGSVIYAMCAGHPPFRAETAYGILRRITDDRARPLREINPQLPSWLGQVVDRLLAKSASQRFASAHQVAELFEQCLAHVHQPHLARLPAPYARSNVWSKRLGLIVVAVGMLVLASVAQRPIRLPKFVEDLPTPTPPAARDEQAIESTVNAATVAASQRQSDVTDEMSDGDSELRWNPDDDLKRLESTLLQLNDEFDKDPP